MAGTGPIKRITVMGGAGHVGLPLGLALAQVGFEVTLYDTNEAALDLIQGGRVPFQEEGAEELLQQVLPTGRLLFRSNAGCMRGADAIITVIGTPVDEHLNPKLTTFMQAMETIFEHLRDGQLLILRSTVSPGTCARLDDRIQQSGKRVHLAFCPERIVEGKALEEIPKLPQIISGFTPEAVGGARSIFERLGPEIIELPPAEAELSKLFVNAWRYLKFAVANQFYMIANEFGLDFERILGSIRYNYPRGQDLPQPGFAAGPCLFKDTMQLAASHHAGFQLGHAAMLVNEGLPDYIVRRLAARYPLRNMTVGILGMSFKAESDDVRESLSFKLRKVLLMQGSTVLCSDPHVPDPSFISPEALVERADLIIIGAPHGVFRSLDTFGKPLVDIWNLYGRGRTI
jgi:UDP-N-acetyl-D-mannosaminuronic acid dehydrogenase